MPRKTQYKLTHRERAKRRDLLIAEAHRFKVLTPTNVANLCSKYGLSEDYVVSICKDMGMKTEREPPSQTPSGFRMVAAIQARKSASDPVASAAKRVNPDAPPSRQYVHQTRNAAVEAGLSMTTWRQAIAFVGLLADRKQNGFTINECMDASCIDPDDRDTIIRVARKAKLI